jgi:hypothetical protein
MRPDRLRLKAIAAWLGVIALGFNALVPVHLAFDLADAIAPAYHHAGAEADHDFVRSLLTLLIGHDEDQDQPASNKQHHHDHCAVCAAVGTLAGFAPVTVVPLAVPASVYIARLTVAPLALPRPAPPAAYHARAPPFA